METWLIATKELRELLYNPRFMLVFAAGAVLILLSVFNGYIVYQSESGAAREAEADARERLADEKSYDYIDYQASRFPNKLSIFGVGLSGVIGRRGSVFVSSINITSISDNRFESDPILAVFGELDLTFTTSYILSVFAILFSFNAISGEREAGTLRLLLAGSTRRTSVIIAKLVGGYLPLALTFLLPFLLALFGLLTLTGIGFSPGEWGKIALMVIACLLYLLVFHSMGVAFSSLTRNSFVSFMLCLLFWVLSAAIIPKGAVNAASLINPSMNYFEFEKAYRELRRESRMVYGRTMARLFKENPVKMEEFRTKRREYAGKADQESSAVHRRLEGELHREYLRQRRGMLATAANLARISPSSNLSFIFYGLADTAPDLRERFEEELRQYGLALANYLDEMKQKQTAAGDSRERVLSYKFVPGTNGYMTVVSENVEPDSLDFTGMPRFDLSEPTLAAATDEVLIDYAVLAFYVLLFFAVAYVAFLRYDAR